MAIPTPKNDMPTLEDGLKRASFVQQVGDLVASCTPPYAIGVHGDWGAGKTSFLHQLHWYLAGECPALGCSKNSAEVKPWVDWKEKQNVTVVWFEAWRYQNEQAPIVALLHEIRSQLPLYSKALNTAKKLSQVGVRAALLSFEDLTGIIGVQAPKLVSNIEAAGKRWEEEHFASKLPAHMVREQLSHALKQLLGNSVRLVVLVDDLDRCEGTAAFKLLEGIKLYLNLPNCVFVFGMDQRVVERAIELQYPDKREGGQAVIRGREYLEKICTDIRHLPLVRDQAKLLELFLPEFAPRKFTCKVIRDYRCLPTNARKIKAFANLLLQFAEDQKWPVSSSVTACEETAKRCVIFASLYQFHYDLYRRLEANPRFYRNIWEWAKAPESVSDVPGYTIFAGLEAVTAGTDLKSPTPQSLETEMHPDPVVGNVFRIQQLVRDVGHLEEDEVKSFLLS